MHHPRTMRSQALAAVFSLMFALVGVLQGYALEAPTWLPKYQIAANLDVEGHTIQVTQHVTWTNRHDRPTDEMVFNVHSAYAPPSKGLDYLFLAKMLEIMRVPAHEGVYSGKPCRIRQVYLFRPGKDGLEKVAVPFDYRPDIVTALVVQLPQLVRKGETITVAIDFDFYLPQKQGRWGQWKGVTFLTNWLPMVAFYDEEGWQPTPFVAWHQPWFNEAGVFDVRMRLPIDQKIACSGSIRKRVEDGKYQEVSMGPVTVRDFSLVCSAQFEEHLAEVGDSGVQVKCLALPGHEFYGKAIAKISQRAVEQYTKWFGPLPYPQLTLVESYFGWNGNECSDLIMIDQRVFQMPEFAEGYVEYLVSHETCHQWWYNVIGTDGYKETFMDEAFVVHFTHKHLDRMRGKNNALFKYPKGFDWAPNVHRENYRFSQFYTTVGRAELGPALQEMPKYGHVGNLFSAAYDRGSKIVGTMEDRLGEAAFLDFTRLIYSRYYFRVIRAKDYQRELEDYTGRSWDGFFQRWMYTNGMTDWAIDDVTIKKVPATTPPKPAENFLGTVASETKAVPYRAVVYLKQKADFDEPTWLGFSFNDQEKYQFKIPIDPSAGTVTLEEPPARIEPMPDGRVRVEILLPDKPTQIAVDPDQVLADTEPANNYWKTRVRVRVTPFYTFLDETGLTTAYDRLNVTAGPWLYGAAYMDPWFTRATVVGARAGVYRTDEFNGGVYVGYRPDFRDLAAGFDFNWINPLFPKTELGFHGEKSLTKLDGSASDLDRLSAFARYTFQESASLYTAPMHYVEGFASWQHNIFPYMRTPIAGTDRFEYRSNLGLHYHLDFLTPYWNPEVGFKFDTTYAAGLPIFGQTEVSHQITSQLSWLLPMPEGLGYFSETRVAVRMYGAYATPTNGLLFSLGGNMLFRGFDMKERQGNAAWIGSAEWRLPVYRQAEDDVLDHVVGLRNLYLAPFYDAGDMYVQGRSEGGVAHAVGVGLRADLAWLSFIERTMLRVDVAKTVNANTGIQVWFGIQHPF